MSKDVSLSAGRPSAGKSKVATLARLLSDTAGAKRVNFQLTADLHARLKVYAAKRGKTITQVLTEYVEALPNE